MSIIISERSAKRKFAACLAAVMCFCVIAGGCGNKDTSPAESETVSSQTATADTASKTTDSEKAESKDAASSKAASDKDASSKAASEKSTSSKAASEKSTSSKAASEKSTSSKAAAVTSSETVSSAAVSEKPSSTESKKTESTQPKEESKAEETSSGYKAGQTVAVYIEFGHIAMNGSPAKIGAYDYWITYDTSLVEYVSAEDQITEDMKVVNDTTPGSIKLAQISALGFNEDFSGEPRATFKLNFKVKADTDDLGITGECPSLTAVSMDGKDLLTLVSKTSPQDKYSRMTIKAE